MSKISIPEYERRPHFLPVVFVGIVGVVVSLLLFVMASNWQGERESRAFVTAADDRISSLKTRMDFKIEKLNSLAVFFESSEYVSHEEFHHFVSHLTTDREVSLSYVWVPYIRQSQRINYEQAVRASGITDYEITELKAGKRIRAADRFEYFPIQYQKSHGSNGYVVGHDLGTSPQHLMALNAAGESLQPRSTVLPEMFNAGDQAGIVIFVPVIKGHLFPVAQGLQGFVAGMFSPYEILTKSTHDFEPAGIDLNLFDVSTASAPLHLARYSSRTRDAVQYDVRQREALLAQPLVYSRQITVAGSIWEIVATPAPAFFTKQNNLMPQLILIFGIVLTGILCMMLYTAVRNVHAQKSLTEAAINSKKALQQSEKMLSQAQQMARLGNWHWDIQSNKLQWSDEIYRIFGLEPQQFGASYDAFLNAVHPDDREMVDRASTKAVESGTPYSIDHRIVLPDGSERFVHEEGEAIFKDGKAIEMMGTVQDISERRELEDQLRHAQRMEAVGTLVGGIAHDFNNTLAAIQGNIYLAKRASVENDIVLRKLDEVEKLGGRAADMINKLLTFSRKDSVSLATFSLNELLDETLELARRGFAEDVEIQCNLSQENLTVSGDVSLLEQVILNLLNNAYDAVADAKEPLIHCSLQPCVADAVLQMRHPELKGELFALLMIKDNGCGIPAKHLDHVFDPFFTTKEVGKGTGLGLSMAYGAIKNHGGVIDVSSQPGKGCEFRIYLPVYEGEVTVSADQLDADAVTGEGETILLVDDHQDIRLASAEVLRSLGYQVIEAENGKQAVALFTSNRGRIDLILTDVVMPKMSGIEAVRRIRQLSAELPALFVSGYNEEKVGMDAEMISRSAMLAKPYTVLELAQQLRTLLNDK